MFDNFDDLSKRFNGLSKRFDKLFNEFMKPAKPKTNMGDEIGKIIQALQNYKASPLMNNFGDSMEQQLGPPDEISEIISDGLRFKKLIWNTDMGQFVKILITSAEGEPNTIQTETVVPENKSLEEQLEEAVESENFELAIELRNQINKNENNPKRKRNSKSTK